MGMFWPSSRSRGPGPGYAGYPIPSPVPPYYDPYFGANSFPSTWPPRPSRFRTPGFFKDLFRGNGGGNDYRDSRSSRPSRQRHTSLPPAAYYSQPTEYYNSWSAPAPPSPPAYRQGHKTVPLRRSKSMRRTEDPSTLTAFYSGTSPTQQSFNRGVRFAPNNGYTYQR